MGMVGPAIKHAARRHARSATCTAHNMAQDRTRQHTRHINIAQHNRPTQHRTKEHDNSTSRKLQLHTHADSCVVSEWHSLLLPFQIRATVGFVSSVCLPPLSCMAPHLTPAEFDFIQQQEALGKSPIELHDALTRRRARQGLATPTLPRFRLALRGLVYKRARKETGASW